MVTSRTVAVAVSLAILTAGCGASDLTAGAAEDPVAAPGDSEATPTVTPAEDVVPEEPEPVEEPEVVPDGRLALAAAQGDPHILWFWGPH